MDNLFGSTSCVYLAKYAEESIYKIGRTNDVNKRLARLNISLPHRIEMVYHIPTDDPKQLERYWHTRFSAQRRPGSGVRRPSEWFNLTDADVREFKTHRSIPKPKREEFQNKQFLLEEIVDTERANAIRRVVDYYSALASDYPKLTVKLANSCNYQVGQLNAIIINLQNVGKAEDVAIARWEKAARKAAKKKVERSEK